VAKKSEDGAAAPVKLRLKMSARSDESGSGQVTRQLREMISAGRLKPGDVLPSEDGLAEQLGVGRKVVRYAYGKLVEEGLLVKDFPRNKRVAGRGMAKGASKKAGAGKSAPQKTRSGANAGRAAKKK
jgi:DNA-binding transcriptional regulator YhcF (GntR family)